MEDIILSLEPLFHRVEKFVLWHNRYTSLLAFIIGHAIFYAIARTGLKPYCAITLVLFIFHLLDYCKKKHSSNEEKKLSDLTQLILRSYRHVCNTHEKLNIIKSENRTKYSIIMIIICLMLAYIGMKINGYYVSYLVMLIGFTLPAIIYHKLLSKLLIRLAPILEQLDQSMEYKRRTLVDRKDLLVKIKTPGLNENDDEDGNIQKLKQQERKSSLIFAADEDNEQNLISIVDENKSLINSELSKETNQNDSSFDMLSSDSSSSSVTDDDAIRINEIYANVGDRIDGKQRIRLKGTELKVKGRSNIIKTNFFQSDNTNLNKRSVNGEPDLTSFDFLNDYDN